MNNQRQQVKKDSQKFEESLQRLEEIVEAMEKGELSLDQTLQHYEEGMKLAKACAEKLGDAEKRIEVLSKKNQAGQDIWSKFELTAEDES